jgi:predicted RNase H-like HicB family nuclease
VRLTKRRFTAVVSREDEWWVGFILEVPGVNCQERTRRELMASLRSALTEALEIRRELTLSAVPKDYEEQPVLV